MVLAGANKGVGIALDWSAIWSGVGAIAAVLALIGVVVGVVAYRRQFPKRQLEWSVDARPLMAEHLRPEEFEVKVKGIEIRDPHIVDFVLFSNSRADIPSSAFDGGLPIRVRIEPGQVVFLGDREAPGGIATSGGDGDGEKWAEVEVGPVLIRKRSKLTLTFVTSGSPKVTLPNWPMIDIAEKEVDASAFTAADLLDIALPNILGVLVATLRTGLR